MKFRYRLIQTLPGLCALLFLAHGRLLAQAADAPDSAVRLREVTVTYQAGETTPVTLQNLSGRVLNVKSTGQEPAFLLAGTPSITAYSDAGNGIGQLSDMKFLWQ